MSKEVEKISQQRCVGCSMKEIQALLITTPFSLEIADKRMSEKRTNNGLNHSASIEFEIATTHSLMNGFFTNHECIPSLESAYLKFKQVYPCYEATKSVDEIREREYSHLRSENHVCMDYFGFGLLSHLQYHHDVSSSLFSLSYACANLPSYALYGAVEQGTIEFQIRNRIIQFLRIQEKDDYALVFTAGRGCAFGLLAESYPFHVNRRLLTVYDYEDEGLNWMVESAKKKGAKNMSALFKWPSMKICTEELKKALTKKKRSEESSAKGLFVFPVQSRVTGAKYSYQWMSYAHRNGWHVVLDASALGPKDMDSLGLSLCLPEFIICSFYKVYGEDPTGFGCLLIKKSVVSCLHTSSAARGIGMVKIVPMCSVGISSVPSNNGIQDGLCSERTDDILRGSDTPNCRLKNKQLLNLRAFSGSISALSRGDQARKSVINISHRGGNGHKTAAESFTEANFGSSWYDHSISQLDIPSSSTNGDAESLRNGASVSKSERRSLKVETMEEIVELDENEEKPFQNSDFMHSNGIKEEAESMHLGHLRGSIRSRNINLSGTRGMERKPPTQENSKDARKPLDGSTLGDEHNRLQSKRLNGDGLITRPESQLLLRGLDHLDSVGLNRTNSRLRYLINWLVNALSKLCHPHGDNSWHLVKIHGPKVKYNRAASVAFNLYDWKGELVEPLLVLKLADRSKISLGYGVLQNIWFPDKYEDRVTVLETKNGDECSSATDNIKHQARTQVIPVVTATLGFVTNFEDVYRLWAFVAKFLDADFVDKERWRYRGLNQKTIEI